MAGRFLTLAEQRYYGSDNIVNKFGTRQEVRQRVLFLVESERGRDRIRCSDDEWVLNARAGEIAWLEDVCIILIYHNQFSFFMIFYVMLLHAFSVYDDEDCMFYVRVLMHVLHALCSTCFDQQSWLSIYLI